MPELIREEKGEGEDRGVGGKTRWGARDPREVANKIGLGFHAFFG